MLNADQGTMEPPAGTCDPATPGRYSDLGFGALRPYVCGTAACSTGYTCRVGTPIRGICISVEESAMAAV